MRQRRVGETSWIDAKMKITDITPQAWRLRGQKVSRRTPNGCGSVAATPTLLRPALARNWARVAGSWMEFSLIRRSLSMAAAG